MGPLARRRTGVGFAPLSVAVGDFNGDGRQDLAVVNQGSATVSVLLGNGNGTFWRGNELCCGDWPPVGGGRGFQWGRETGSSGGESVQRQCFNSAERDGLCGWWPIVCRCSTQQSFRTGQDSCHRICHGHQHGSGNSRGCSIAPLTSVPASFAFQTTNTATNQVTGFPNAAVDIAAGAAQSFVLALTPTATLSAHRSAV